MLYLASYDPLESAREASDVPLSSYCISKSVCTNTPSVSLRTLSLPISAFVSICAVTSLRHVGCSFPLALDPILKALLKAWLPCLVVDLLVLPLEPPDSPMAVISRPVPLPLSLSSYGAPMAATAVWPNKLSMTPLRLGMQTVSTERPRDICVQIMVETAFHVASSESPKR